MAVAFCISGHGFGHASRQVEVINAFGTLRPDQAVHVFTMASKWLLDRTIRVPVSVIPVAVDSGAIQRDSLAIDIPATLAAAASFEAGADKAAVDLAREFRERAIEVAVCDAPPMPCTAAHLAGVPAIVLSNFTWDWIYEDFTTDHQAFAALPARLGLRYAAAAAAWRLPMYGGFDTFGTVLDFPWVARRSTQDRDEVRRLIGAEGPRPLVLVSFGGYGVADMTLAHHENAPYRLVWSGGAQHGPVSAPADALRLDRDELSARGLRYEDLVAAADVVVSKPGYGIVSECVANGAALLYTERGRFREYGVMVEQMPEVLRCRHMSTEALAGARWDADVEALLAQPPPATRPLVNGAEVAAGMLSAML